MKKLHLQLTISNFYSRNNIQGTGKNEIIHYPNSDWKRCYSTNSLLQANVFICKTVIQIRKIWTKRKKYDNRFEMPQYQTHLCFVLYYILYNAHLFFTREKIIQPQLQIGNRIIHKNDLGFVLHTWKRSEFFSKIFQPQI